MQTLLINLFICSVLMNVVLLRYFFKARNEATTLQRQLEKYPKFVQSRLKKPTPGR